MPLFREGKFQPSLKRCEILVTSVTVEDYGYTIMNYQITSKYKGEAKVDHLAN